jgi:chemotaxis protein CheD
MAEVKVIRSPYAVLMALGLGSCIGICAYDLSAGVAGLAHIVLPESGGHQGSPGKFADTGVPLLLEEMKQVGASLIRLRVALVGGAQLFAGNGTGPKLDIGPRNAGAVQAVLARCGIPVVATDLGGNIGRTVYLYGDGRVHVKTIGRGEEQLICFSASEKERSGGRLNALQGGSPQAMPRKEALPSATGINPAFLRRVAA